MKNLRTHGKSLIVWILLGLLVLGLGGFGVTNFSGSSGQIGSVGETDISAEEYERGLRSELNNYSQQAGQQITMAQAQTFGLPQAVQARLFTAAALEEEARRLGVSVGDARVAETISQAPAFNGPTGQFDRNQYAEILRREGISQAEFEDDVRMDEARLILQRAVVGGVTAPAPMVDQTADWLLETRDITWRELTADMLKKPVADPDEATLSGWHQANADRFTAPEQRKITYVWLTPEMLAPDVELDEAALRTAYADRADEYQQPERRMVERLVYPSEEEAAAAKARLDRGEATFEALAIERGLTLEDADLGEVTESQLGAAGAPIFALDGPGVVGPLQSDLGPALYAMNAILDPVNISFEEALPDLRAEAAADRARRVIDDRTGEFEDLLASGATLEDVAEETPMELGQIDWNDATNAEQGSIANYPAFREQADAATEADFPQLYQLDDGGVFALRLDEIVPPTLTPLDDIRDEVAADWRAAETQRLLLAKADKLRLGLMDRNEALPETAPDTDTAPAPETADNELPTGRTVEALARDGWIEEATPDLLTAAFALEEVGETAVVDAKNRVFLVTLDKINPADLSTDQAAQVLDAVRRQQQQSLQGDLFDYFTRSVQQDAGFRYNQGVIDSVNAQVQ